MKGLRQLAGTFQAVNEEIVQLSFFLSFFLAGEGENRGCGLRTHT